MAYPVLIKMYLKGNEITGPADAFGLQGAWQGHEFSHCVHAWEHNNGWEIKWMHAHHPLSVVLEVDSFLPELYRTIARGEKLDQVELHWPQYQQTDNAERIYFKTTLHPARISSIRQFYPNIKDRQFQTCNHLVCLEFRYRWIEWEYVKGKLCFKDEWIEYIYDQFGPKSEQERKELEAILSGPALTDELLDEPKEKLAIENVRWVHKDDVRAEESPDAAGERDSILLYADIKNYVEGAGVDFHVWDYAARPKKQIAKLHTRCKGNVAEVEWPVDLSKASAEPDLKFECEARNKLSEQRKVPIVFAPATVKPGDVCIAFFFDGTGKNEEVDRPRGCDSNIAKLHELYDEVEDDSGVFYRQAKYINGVGTDHWYSDFFGLAFGATGKSKIAEAFRALAAFARTHRNEPQIHVDVFGFSRGAALARQFVNAYHAHGIVDREAQPIGTRSVRYYAGGDYHTRECPVYPKQKNITFRFVGLFDTVGSFGLPGNDIDLGYALDVNPNHAQRIVQFTAKHEYRRNYDLISIRSLANGAKVTNHHLSSFMSTKPAPPNMLERAFIGSHGDVGGGIKPGDEGKTNDLALVPLFAMLDEARNVGVKFYDLDEYLDWKPERMNAFSLSPDLERLNSTRTDWHLYAEVTDETARYFSTTLLHYMHDSSDDGIFTGTFLDKGDTNRSVYYYGAY